MFALLVVVVEGVHGLLVLPVHPALFTESHNRTNADTTHKRVTEVEVFKSLSVPGILKNPFSFFVCIGNPVCKSARLFPEAIE